MSTPISRLNPKETALQRFAKVIGVLLAIIGLLVVVLLLASALFFRSAVNSWLGGGETHITSSTIGGSFEDIAELSVEEYNFTNVGKYDRAGLQVLGHGVPLSGKSFLLTYDGTVKAGIQDSSAIDVSIDDSSRAVNLDVPAVSITSASIDPASITVYDQSMNPFNQVKIEDLSQFLTVETDNARNKAVANGLMDRARTRSEELLKSQVNAATKGSDKADYDVHVKWRD